MDNYNIMEEAVKHYGRDNQIKKSIEEMGELTTVLMRQAQGNDLDNQKVVTEIADVAIMSFQLALIYGLDKVKDEIDRKLEQLKDTIHPEVTAKINYIIKEYYYGG